MSRRDDHPDHPALAEHWLNRAADNGHGLAAYNLAVAHLRGDLPSAKHEEEPKREVVHGLLSKAVRGGVHEALGLLHLCGHGQCAKQRKVKSQ